MLATVAFHASMFSAFGVLHVAAEASADGSLELCSGRRLACGAALRLWELEYLG